jgi:hypothetical protein
MEKRLRPPLIKFNRVLSWALAVFAVAPIATGYAQTILDIEFEVATRLHAIFAVLFLFLFFIHAVFSLFLIWYDWGENIRKYLRGDLSRLSKMRLAQRMTGLALLISGFYVSVTGVDWFKLGLGWLFPFKSHINYDVFLTVSGILHVAIGINFALKRRHLMIREIAPVQVVSQTRRDSIILVAGTVVTLFSALYLGSLTKLSSAAEKIKSLLPPGQYEVASLRKLHVELPDHYDEDNWSLEVGGLVEKPLKLSYKEVLALPRATKNSPFHCVTGWSRLNNTWEGVLFSTIMRESKPLKKARFATIECERGYTTSLPLSDLARDDIILAYGLDNVALPHPHGGPLRLVVPHKYAYKSAKWVRKIRFTERQELGYWEVRGYSNTANPWTEDRYAD